MRESEKGEESVIFLWVILLPQPDWLSLFHMIVCDGQWIHINIWFAFLPHFLGMFLFPNFI